MTPIDLHGILLHFIASESILHKAWQALFVGWTPSTRPIGAGSIQFECRLVSELPPFPQSLPLYADEHDGDNLRANQLTVFPTSIETVFQVAFSGMGLVRVDTERSRVEATIHRDCLRTGRFPDLIFTSLAPILRRRQIFLLHSLWPTASRRHQITGRTQWLRQIKQWDGPYNGRMAFSGQ